MSRFFGLPTKGSRSAVTSSLFAVALVFLIAAIVAQNPDWLAEDLALEVAHPERIVPEGGALVLPVRATLTNNTDEVMDLTAPDPCRIFRWVLLSPAGDFVMSTPREPCDEPGPALTPLYPDTTATLREDLNLAPGRVPPGTYRLRYSYWGEEGESDIQVGG
jgi:hypothetical protein